MEKFTKTNAERYIKNNNDAQVAQLGHLNAIVEKLPSYKSYVSQVTQSGISTPVANVLLDDTNLNPTWVRLFPGGYQLLFNKPVPLNKLVISNGAGYQTFGTIYNIISSGSQVDGYIGIFPILGTPTTLANGIQIELYDDLWNSIEWSSLIGAVTTLYIEFKVFI